MVRGIERFREYFRDFTDQYVLIGGAACDISFRNYDADFRATRDLDVVLIVEALTREFGQRFWEFIRDGGYQNRTRSTGTPQFFPLRQADTGGLSSHDRTFRTDREHSGE